MIKYMTREEFVKTQNVIHHPTMEPFFIVKSSSGEFQVCEETTTQSDHHLSDGKEKTVVRIHAYLSTLGNALRSISHRKTISNKKEYTALDDYISKYEDVMVSMRELAKSIG